MNMSISTLPAAICTLIISYGQKTPSSSFGLVPHTADANGTASWRWQVAATVHTGVWPLVISAVMTDGTKITTQVNVTVTLPPVTVVANQSVLAVYPKSTARLTVSTAPNTTCTLLLNDVPGQPTKTLTQRADGNGMVSWTWNVEALTPVGVRPLFITATLADGESISNQAGLTVL